MLTAEGLRLKETYWWVTSSLNRDEAETFNAAFASFSNTGLVMGGVQSPGLDGHGWGSDELLADFELVWDLLLQLNTPKSMGPSGIPPRVLKSWPM